MPSSEGTAAVAQDARTRPETGRVRVFDVVRGFSVLSMICFHLCYDLRFIAGLDLAWFAPPLQDVWRASISWTFLFVAGCMCRYSRDNLRRAGKYLLLAAAIFLATFIARVDVPISFGVIFCMGACTLVWWLLSRASLEPKGPVAAAIFLACFLMLLDLPGGHVWLFGIDVQVPGALYQTEWLSWLGFPGPAFSSGDYYPLLPFLMMYLAGASLCGSWRERGLPGWCSERGVRPLEWMGRHALPVYVIHQPLILLVLLALGIL